MHIHSLPVEVLAEIFSCDIQPDRGSLSTYSKSKLDKGDDSWIIHEYTSDKTKIILRRTPLNQSLAILAIHVCTRWRLIAQGSASLWTLRLATTAHADESSEVHHQLGAFTDAIEAQKGTNLEIHLHEPVTRSNPPPGGDKGHEQSEQLFCLIIALSSLVKLFHERVTEINLFVLLDRRLNAFFTGLSGTTFPRLSSSTVALPTGPIPQLIPIETDPCGAIVAPAFRHLDVSCSLPIPPMPLVAIVDLALRFSSQRTWGHWHTALASCPNLLDLVIELYAAAGPILFWPLPGAPVTLPQLERLEIKSCHGERPWHIFFSMTMPELQEFSMTSDTHLNASWPDINDLFIGFSFHKLTKVSIQPLSLLGARFIGLLDLPAVTHIRVSHVLLAGKRLDVPDTYRDILLNHAGLRKLEVMAIRDAPPNVLRLLLGVLSRSIQIIESSRSPALDVDTVCLGRISDLDSQSQECLESLQFLTVTNTVPTIMMMGNPQTPFRYMTQLRTLRFYSRIAGHPPLQRYLPWVPSPFSHDNRVDASGYAPNLEVVQIVVPTLSTQSKKKWYPRFSMGWTVGLVEWLARCWRTRPLQVMTFSYCGLELEALDRLEECVPEVYHELDFIPPYEMRGLHDRLDKHKYYMGRK